MGTRQPHTWCAWDTLFLPALSRQTAAVRSLCPVSGSVVELVVAPDGVMSAHPADLNVSFPPLAATDTADITGSFCCHTCFLAGADAARTWRETRADDSVFDIDTAVARPPRGDGTARTWFLNDHGGEWPMAESTDLGHAVVLAFPRQPVGQPLGLAAHVVMDA